jgi:hypothetical protein
LNGQGNDVVDQKRDLIKALIEIRFGRRLCPVEQNCIHPGWVAGGDRLVYQIEEAPQLLLEIRAYFHAARQLKPHALDPHGAHFGHHYLNGS